jgi:hypothetical protein
MIKSNEKADRREPTVNPADNAQKSYFTGPVAATTLIAASIIVGILLVELATSVFFKPTARPSDYDWAHRIMFFSGAESIFQNQGKIFTYAPNDNVRDLTIYYSDNAYVVEYDYQFRANNYGLVQDLDVNPNRPSLLVLGDSFTEGQGAAPWFRKLLMQSENDRYQIINGGLLGTGFGQWDLLQDYLSTERKINIQKLLVIFISDDYSRGVWNFSPVDLLCLRSIEACSLDQTIYYRLPILSNLSDWVSRIRKARNLQHGLKDEMDQITKQVLPSTYQAFEYLKAKGSYKAKQRKELSRAAIEALIQKYNTKNLVFLHLPQKDETSGPNERGLEARRAIQGSGGNLLDGFKLCPLSSNEYYLHDGHPNERGYSRIADCVSTIVHQMTDSAQ